MQQLVQEPLNCQLLKHIFFRVMKVETQQEMDKGICCHKQELQSWISYFPRC